MVSFSMVDFPEQSAVDILVTFKGKCIFSFKALLLYYKHIIKDTRRRELCLYSKCNMTSNDKDSV